MKSADPIQRLVLELGRLPGIGERSATRLAFHIIRETHGGKQGATLAEDLAAALVDVVKSVGLCTRCRNLSLESECRICSDPQRDKSTMCVVESVQDLRALEGTGAFKGRYHVLHGALAPLDGIGPDDLRLDELIERLRADLYTEVVLATNADVEGDVTALYLARLIRPLDIKVTRLASGIPLGGELEYIDSATLGRALSDRREF